MRCVTTILAAISILALALAADAQEPRRGRGEAAPESRLSRGPETGRTIAFDILFADLGADKAGGEMTAAKILELDKQGQLDASMRIKLSVVENTPGMVQFGETVGVATGRQNVGGFGDRGGFGGDRGGTTVFSRQSLGVVVTVTARAENDATVVAEVSAERSRLAPRKAADADDAAAASEPQKILTTTSRTTIRAASGEPVILGGQQTSGDQAAQTYIVLTATAPEPKAAAAAAPAGLQERPRASVGPAGVIKVFALSNSRAADVVRAIGPILEGQPIALTSDERTNSIIVQGRQKELETAAALIQQLDEK
jgi:type II secretory pathway component GspD/PulD (secretin)